MKAWFSRAAAKTAYVMGTPAMFIANVLLIVAWLVSGPYFHFSNGWSFLINNSTTVLTWLLAILILNDSNRNATALHTKLDALITALHDVPNEAAGIESLSEDELASLKQRIDLRINR